MTSSATPNRTQGRWNTRDMLVTIVIGLAFGIIVVPVTYVYVSTLALGILARAAVGGLYFIPPAFAMYVMQRRGAGLLVSFISGLAAMPFSPHGTILLIVGLFTGILSEIAFWLTTRYRHFTWQRMAVAGLIAGIAEYVLILFSLRTTEWGWGVMGAAALLSGITFAVGAIVGKSLADAVAKTGVLNHTKLGESLTHHV